MDATGRLTRYTTMWYDIGMIVYVVSITKDGRWHCFNLSGDIPMHHLVGKGYYEKTASQLIRDLVIGSENPWHEDRDKHMFAYAIHARSRYQAIKMAKEAYRARMISATGNRATGRLT